MKHDYTLTNDVNKSGHAFLVYGKTGVGKSGSLATCDGNLLAYNAEDKDLGVILSDVRQVTGKNNPVRIKGFDTFDEYEGDMNELHARYAAGERPYDLIFFDGFTFLQSNFKMDFEDSRFDLGLTEKDSKGEFKRTDTIADRFRIEQGDWGGLASAMCRITKVLVSFTVYGVNVIATAQEMEYPKYNRNVEVGPAFVGKGYGQVMPGYWHYIGHVVPGSTQVNGFYMPVVRFVSDGSFIGRSSSVRLNEKLAASGGYAPLDWNKILRVIEGR